MTSPLIDEQFLRRVALQFVSRRALITDQTKLESSHFHKDFFLSNLQSALELNCLRLDFEQSWSDVLTFMLHHQFLHLRGKECSYFHSVVKSHCEEHLSSFDTDLLQKNP